MAISKRFLVASTLIGLGLAVAAPPAAAGTAQPDGEVKKKGRPYIGLGVVNDTGENQTVSATRGPGKTAVYKFRFENVGSATDDFTIDACSAQPDVKARYFRGSRNISEKLAAGTFVFRDVGTGDRTPVITAKVKVRAASLGGFELAACVEATASNPIDSDAPAWRIVVPEAG
jgi:hypothetical protein